MRGLLLIASVALSLGGVPAARAAARSPVLVELFTAQGCTGCPRADRLLQEIAAKPGVVALTLPVDYWDYLGWADTFAKPEFTARQRAYADRLKVREIYTPEVVVDGRREASGLDEAAIDKLIEDGRGELAGGPHVAIAPDDGRVRVGAARTPPGRAEVWLVRFDPQEETVRVRAGDNKGKLVSQRYVVRELQRLGSYAGAARSYALPKPTESGLSTLVLVQGAKGGRVLALGAG